MVSTQVDNYGARRFRRAKTTLSILYSTPPEKIEAFCEGIRELVRLHPYTRKDYYHVYFNEFSASSLDILLYIFFDAPDWATELRERHYLFLDILRLAQRLGVEFAFPTQTVWLQQTPEAVPAEAPRPEAAPAERPFPAAEAPSRAPSAFPEGPLDIGIEEAAKLYRDVYGTPPATRGRVIVEKAPKSKREEE
jgi:MscS family membrane protein